MLFLLLRIIFLGILILLTIIFFKWLRIPIVCTKIMNFSYGKVIKKIISKRFLIQIILCLLLFFISFYPFEGIFMRFYSADSSLRYSVIDYNWSEFEIIEDKNCDFVFGYSNNSLNYYSISKYNDGFSLVNYDSIVGNYKTTSVNELNISCSANGIYNKYADKTCIFLNTYFVDENLLIMYDNQVMQEYYSPYYRCRVYYLVINGNEVKNTIKICINDTVVNLNKSFVN